MIKCAQASLGTDSIKSLKNTNDFLGVATYELSKRAAGRDDWIYHRTSVLSPNAARASPFWLRLRRAKYLAFSAVQTSSPLSVPSAASCKKFPSSSPGSTGPSSANGANGSGGLSGSGGLWFRA